MIFAEATESRLRLRLDRPQDVNGDGDMWDVVDANDDGDSRDDDENENADGFLNDPLEDLTYVHDLDARTFTLIDNVTDDVYVLAEGVIANPGGAPAFRYERDGDTILSITVELTVEAAVVDFVRGAPATSTGRVSARPRLTRSRVLDSLSGSD